MTPPRAGATYRLLLSVEEAALVRMLRRMADDAGIDRARFTNDTKRAIWAVAKPLNACAPGGTLQQ